jgi:hypothetical protein
MLQLHRYVCGRFRVYPVSEQRHCEVGDVERWLDAAAGASGVIPRARIEVDGTRAALVTVAEAHVSPVLYVADHNEYVTRNLQYALEPSEEPTVSDIDMCDSDDDVSLADVPLESDFEVNEELTVHEFESSHQKNHEW